MSADLLARRYPPVSRSERLKLAALSALCHPLRLRNIALRGAGLKPRGAARVLIYHDVAPHEQKNLEAQLRWLKARWRFVSAHEFADIVGAGGCDGRALLLTFDDGYASNRVVAESILKPLAIPALFFVVRQFIEIRDSGDARRFIAARLLPGAAETALPPHLRNMTWNDLEALLEQGHSVGAHTDSHAWLSRVATPTELRAEIVESGDAVARRLGTVVDHFAFPFGSLASVDQRAIEVASSRYPFIHSGLRGDNAAATGRRMMRREAVTPADPVLAVGAVLEGACDAPYVKDAASLDLWASGGQC